MQFSLQDEEYKAGEMRLRKLLLRLVKGGLRVWQPSLDELLQMIDVSFLPPLASTR